MQALLHQSEAALTCALCSKVSSLAKLTQLSACLHAAPCVVTARLHLKAYTAFLCLTHWYTWSAFNLLRNQEQWQTQAMHHAINAFQTAHAFNILGP